jgi:hypothetical protein
MVPPAPAISTEFLPAAFSRRTCSNMPVWHGNLHIGNVHFAAAARLVPVLAFSGIGGASIANGKQQ